MFDLADYTDMAHKRAVSKLKSLLFESYSFNPVTRKSHSINDIQLITNRTDTESHQGTIENCMILDNSKAKDFHTSIITELVAYPQKLNSYIAQQQKYIQKLEQESRFCRIQLTTLLDNMKMIWAENNPLHCNNKTLLLCKNAFNSNYMAINENLNYDKVSTKKGTINKQENMEVSENIGSEEKQFVDTLRQVEFYKYQCEAEVKKLKAELHKHNEKLLGITRGGDMLNGSMLQAEKQQKKLTEIRQELSQIQDLIDNLKREYQNKISNLQSRLCTALSEKDIAAQKVMSVKLDMQQKERQYMQEENNLQLAINLCKQRLEETNAELIYCRKENLRLLEEMTSLKEEVNINKLEQRDESSVQGLPAINNKKQLNSMIEKVALRRATEVGDCTTKSAPNKKRIVKINLLVKIAPKQK